MSLVTRNPGDAIRSLDIDQFITLLTGLMADQPLALASALSIYGGALNMQPMVSPSITSSSITGTTGATSHGYQIVARNAVGDSIPGATTTITNCPAVLGVSNYVNLAWVVGAGATPANAGFGATSFVVIRDGQSIATIAAVNGQTAYSYQDQGAAGSGYTASTANIGGTLIKSVLTANADSGNPQNVAYQSTFKMTVPAGRWLVFAQGGWNYSTSVAQTYDAQIWDNNTSTPIAHASIAAGNLTGGIPFSMVGLLTVIGSDLIQLRGKVSAVNGTQVMTDQAMYAIAV